MSQCELYCHPCDSSVSGSNRCPHCGGVLTTLYRRADDRALKATAELPGLWRYAPLLPIEDPGNVLTLGEGQTPLVRSERLGPSIGLDNLFFKVESGNPTGSYKDRIAAVGLSRAREQGRPGWIATSSGNAGAALAAFGAKAGLTGVLIVPDNASIAKLAQIRAYRPRIYSVEGFGTSPAVDEAVFSTLQSISVDLGWELSITAHAYSPQAMDGAKTIAFELAEQADPGIDRVYVPSGGGGLAASIIRGFVEWHLSDRIESVPCVTVAQADGCAPIVRSWERGGPLEPVQEIRTGISGVQLGAPPDGDLLLHLLRRHDGTATSVLDDAIYEAQVRLAQEEGLFVEPAGALSVAALIADRAAGRVDPSETTVCLLTGSGFKDRDALERLAGTDDAVQQISSDDLRIMLQAIPP